jgi:hypothetical protein
LGDEAIESCAHVVSRTCFDDRAIVAEEHEIDGRPGALLVAEERLPGAVAVDLHRTGVERLLDARGVATAQAKRSEEP